MSHLHLNYFFGAILDLFINPKYLFQNKSFSQTYYFKSEKSFVILTSLLGLCGTNYQIMYGAGEMLASYQQW